MLSTPKWVSWWFRGAAAYGVLALVPMYFRAPPMAGELVHYGFVGTALAFQVAFWIVGGAPARYRALMPVAVLEKLAFGIPVLLLWFGGRADGLTLAAGLIDLALGAGFLLAWRATPRA